MSDGGTGLVVSAVFGPVTSVKVNDVVPLLNANGLGPGDTVYARWIPGTGPAVVSFVAAPGGATVTIPLSECSYSQIVSIPGPLPTPTLDQALSAATLEACEQVLAQYDAKWGELQGGPECSGLGGSSSGGSSSGGAGGGGTSSGGTAAGGAAGATSGSGGGAGSGNDSGEGCGCVVIGSSESSAEAAIVISAAIILYGARRGRRRTVVPGSLRRGKP